MEKEALFFPGFGRNCIDQHTHPGNLESGCDLKSLLVFSNKDVLEHTDITA